MAGNVRSTMKPKVKSLQKAIAVLHAFSVARPELGVSEISEILRMQKTTVHNILATFEQSGFVEQDPVTRKYRLGIHILHLANIVRQGLGLRRVALPFMEQAMHVLEETVHLAIEQDGEVVYLESVQPPDRSVSRLATGKRVKMHCTGVGKAMLAFRTQEQVRQIVERRGLDRFTSNTITSLERLEVELERTREQGFAVDNMEHEWGIRCIGVPILDDQGRVTAAMSASGPSERFPLDELEPRARSLMALGSEITRRLGWRGK